MPSNPSTHQVSAWNLDDLFPAGDAPAIQEVQQDLERQTAAFEEWRQKLSPEITNATFLEIIRALESIHKTFDRLYGYHGLRFYANTQDQQAQTALAQIQQFAAEIENRTLFFTLWWKDLDDDRADGLLAGSGDYRYWLELLRLFKPHTLAEAEEKIINLKNVSGVQAIRRIYDTITNRYVFHLDGVDGLDPEKPLTREELMTYVRHPSAPVREKAYRELYRVYAADGPLLGQIYEAIVRDWHNENLSLRHFSSPNAVRNLENDIPDDVVDILLDVCKENVPLFQRFFMLKGRELGLGRLRRFDLYAPLMKTNKTYAFSQAVDWTQQAFTAFDERMARLAATVLDKQHVDSETRPGKRSGAFSWSVTNDRVPWVLVNYQGRTDDITTLAHELGHAVHAQLAGHHSLFTYQACLPLAETASTFAEMLMVEKLLDLEEDPAVRRSLLFQQMDDAYATIMRQAFFARFERQAHAALQDGITAEEVAALYAKDLALQFGDALEMDDIFRWEWVTIPHFYETPFYVYAYSFGQLFVLALYQQYKEEGAAFIPRYIHILEEGGAKAPMQILAEAGMDATRASFWEGGFKVLAGWLERLEKT